MGEASSPSVKQRNVDSLNILELKELNIQALGQIAKDLDIPGATGMRKQDLIFEILRAQTERSGLIFSEGAARYARRCSRSADTRRARAGFTLLSAGAGARAASDASETSMMPGPRREDNEPLREDFGFRASTCERMGS